MLFSPSASSESYCFIIHAMGANRPLAGHRLLAVLTVHGTLRAQGSVPPQSHPRSGKVLRSSPHALGRGRNSFCTRAMEPGSGGEQPCSLARLSALLVLTATRVKSNSRSSHSLCTQSLFRLRRYRKPEPLPARGSGASNKPVSTLTPLKQPGSHSTYLE